MLLRVQRAGRGITSRLALVYKQPGLELLSVLKGKNQKDLEQEFPMRPLSLFRFGPNDSGLFKDYPVKPHGLLSQN